MKKGSIKNTRINAEVRRAVSEIVRSGIKDPRISPMTSITDARVTADLKYCTIYVSVLGSGDAAAETLAGLKSATGYIRRELARIVNLRITPELRFVQDSSMEYGSRIERILTELNPSGRADEAGEDGTNAADDASGEDDAGEEEPGEAPDKSEK